MAALGLRRSSGGGGCCRRRGPQIWELPAEALRAPPLDNMNAVGLRDHGQAVVLQLQGLHLWELPELALRVPKDICTVS